MNRSTLVRATTLSIAFSATIGLLKSTPATATPFIVETSPVNTPTNSTIAQASSSVQMIQQGRQIRFNGQTETVTWSQWQTSKGQRTFISEITLTQLLGVQILNSGTPELQPVAWYSGLNRQVAKLPVRLVGTERHLDVTDISKLMSWNLEVKSGQLSLDTLSAKVKNMRVAKRRWGDRIVIELDGPVAYQTNATKDEFRLTLNAQTETPIAKAINQAWQYPKPIDPNQSQPEDGDTIAPPPKNTAPQPGEDPLDQPLPKPVESPKFKRVQRFKLDTRPNRTVLNFGLPIAVRPQILTLNNPTRLVIDVGNPQAVNREVSWTNGLKLREQTINNFPVKWLEIDPKQPGLKIHPILPNQTGINQPAIEQPALSGIATLLQTARKTGAIGAINGGFFNRNTKFPLGAIRINRDWRSGPILSRGVVAWNPSGDFQFDRLVSNATVTKDNQRFELKSFNSAYLQAGIAFYNKDWGLTYTSQTDGEVIATVQNGQVVAKKVAEKPGTIVSIGTQDQLLVFRSNRTGAAKFPVGTPVQFDFQFAPNLDQYQHVIGGGPLLIKAGEIVLDGVGEKFSPAFVRGKASRSAIVQTRGGKILLVSAQNNADSRGPTLDEFAKMLQKLDVVNALNLDGGSSTTLYLGGQILDRAPRSSARVHNAIGIFFTLKR